MISHPYTLRLLWAIVSICSGLVLGLTSGILAPNVQDVDRAYSRGMASAVDNSRRTVSITDLNAEVEKLSLTIDEQKRAIGDLRSRLGDVSTPGEDVKTEAVRAKATEILRCFSEALQPGAPREKLLIAIGRVDELRPEMAVHFMERYSRYRSMAHGIYEAQADACLELLLLCGGDTVGAFIKQGLSEPSQDEQLRSSLLLALSGTCGWFTDLSRIPIDGELVDIANNLIRSDRPNDRLGAIGLLAHSGNPEVIPQLTQLVQSDRSRAVRVAALRSLGVIGTPDCASWLESYLLVLRNGPNAENTDTLIEAGASAIDAIRIRSLMR